MCSRSTTTARLEQPSWGGSGEPLAIPIRWVLINITVSLSIPAQGAMYTPLALKFVAIASALFQCRTIYFLRVPVVQITDKPYDNWNVIKIAHRRGYWGCHEWRCGIASNWDHRLGSVASAESAWTRSRAWIRWVYIFGRRYEPSPANHSDATQPSGATTYRAAPLDAGSLAEQ